MATQGIPTFETKLVNVPEDGTELDDFEAELNGLTRAGWNVAGVVQAAVRQSVATRDAVVILTRLCGAVGVELDVPAVQGVTLDVGAGNGKARGGGLLR